MDSSRSGKGSNSRRPFRIPRSISEQESIMARQGTILTGNPDELPDEMRDLMDLRARGIFDDRDVTDLLEAIKRTQKALASSSSKQLIGAHHPNQPTDKRQFPLKGPSANPKITSNDIIATKFNSSTKKLDNTKKPAEATSQVTKQRLAPTCEKSIKNVMTPIKIKQPEFKLKDTPKTDSKRSSSGAEVVKPKSAEFTSKQKNKKIPSQKSSSPKVVSIQAANKPTSHIHVKAALVSSIDEVKTILAKMTPENIPETQMKLATSIDKALDSLTSLPTPYDRKSKLNLSHSLTHIKVGSASLDPHNVDTMKEVLSRHVDSAENIVIPKKPKRERPKTLAGKIVEYAAKDPTGANIVPRGKSASPRNLNQLKPKEVKPTTLGESSERLTKASVVQFIDRAKTNVAMSNPQNIDIVKEGVCRMINEATKAMRSLKDTMTEADKKVVNEQLEAVKQMTSTWSTKNLDSTKKNMIDLLEKAIQVLLPSNLATSKLPIRRDSLIKEKTYVIDRSPVVTEAVAKLEAAVNSIRNGCKNNEMVLLISPVQDSSKKDACNLQITSVNRKTAAINGNFLIPECNYISLAKTGAFAKYFTVRISRDLKYFDKQIDQILRCVNEIPIVDKKQHVSSHRAHLSLLLKPPLHESMPALTSAAIRRSITINPRNDLRGQCEVDMKKEPTMNELLEIVSSELCTQEDLVLFFDLVERFRFSIFAHPDFQDDRCMYICELFTSSNEYVGTTKVRGDDIVNHLQKRPEVVKNFEVIVDVTDLILPVKFKQALSGFFHTLGLLSVYDRLGMFMFNIYKKWGLNKAK